jgi:hypothetical protein
MEAVRNILVGLGLLWYFWVVFDAAQEVALWLTSL